MQRGSTSGFTLIELLLVLAILGLTTGIALPAFRRFGDGLAVQHATLGIVSAHRRARMSAVLRSRSVELTVAVDSLVIRERGGGPVLWRTPGPALDGVDLAGPSRTLSFSPVGLTDGLANATFRLTRGAATRAVVVSRLGRLRIVP
jgi:prepilin-type N-terminal cleavage/methylation domain-containing protein